MPGTYAPPAVELPNTSAMVGICIAESWMRSRKIWPALMKRSAWVGRSAPPDSTSLDQRQPVDLGDLERPQVLLEGPRVHRPAAHRGVVGDDHALDARHHADAGDDDGTHVELGAPRRQGGELEEGRVTVDEELDALAGEQLAAARWRAWYRSPPPAIASATCSSCSAMSSSSAARLV